jgi:hypothetical protein
MKTTTQKELVEELLARPGTPERAEVIELARAGHFHTLRSHRATPRLDLVEALYEIGDHDLASRALAGEWDELRPETEDPARQMALALAFATEREAKS